MPHLHLRMPAWSDIEETQLVNVESTDKFDFNTQEEFRKTEASLYQELHRSTPDEPLIICQQMQRTEGIRGVARNREDVRSEEHVRQENQHIQHNIDRDRDKDVEQFDDILRTFIDETNQFENRFGKVRDEEKMLAVKSLMLESLLNFRFRGNDTEVRRASLCVGQHHHRQGIHSPVDQTEES